MWSSCSPDFGSASLLDRLRQIEPRILFGVDGYHYAGKRIDCLPALQEVVDNLPSIEHVIISQFVGDEPDTASISNAQSFTALLGVDAELNFAPVEFDDPLKTDVCRDCGICIDYCPTGALSKPRE